MGSGSDTGGGSEKGRRDWAGVAGGGGKGTRVARVTAAIKAAFTQQGRVPVPGQAGQPLMTSRGCHEGRRGQQV